MSGKITTVATPVVGQMPVKEALKANVSVANERSNEYKPTSGTGSCCCTRAQCASSC